MEQQTQVVKQMMDMQKMAVEGMLNNWIMYWDQTEKMVNAFTDQAVWLPEEGKKAIREWTDSGKKGCENIKNAIDDGYKRFERCFVAS